MIFKFCYIPSWKNGAEICECERCHLTQVMLFVTEAEPELQTQLGGFNPKTAQTEELLHLSRNKGWPFPEFLCFHSFVYLSIYLYLDCI